MSRGGRPPSGVDNMYSLKVDNLTYRTSPETLKRAFQKFGDVGDVYIPRDRYSRESRGFAFVRFYDKHDAEDAMDSMDGKELDGRELRVAMARYGRPNDPPEPYRRGPPPGRYGGGGRYDSGRYDRRDSYRDRRRRSRSNDRGRSYSRSRSPRRKQSRSVSRSHSRSPRRSPKQSRNNDSRASRSASRSRSRSNSRSRSRD